MYEFCNLHENTKKIRQTTTFCAHGFAHNPCYKLLLFFRIRCIISVIANRRLKIFFLNYNFPNLRRKTKKIRPTTTFSDKSFRNESIFKTVAFFSEAMFDLHYSAIANSLFFKTSSYIFWRRGQVVKPIPCELVFACSNLA